MTRRALFLAGGALAAGAVRLRADAAGDVWDLLASVASALVNGNLSQFMSAFDEAMPGIDELRANATALVREVSAQSSIEPATNEGDERSRKVEVDWLLILVDPETDGSVARRQQRVACRLAKSGRKWRITAFDPVSLFAPPAQKERRNPR